MWESTRRVRFPIIFNYVWRTIMELWKVHKFCEGASLEELLERREKMIALIENNALSNTNMAPAMPVIDPNHSITSMVIQSHQA